MSESGSHYFSPTPDAPSERHLVRLRVSGVDVDLWTDRGVFAGERVDSGTVALLDEAPHPPDGAVDLLDLGCGYGPIAVTLARRAPKARVWAVDVNTRAVELTRENAYLCGCANLHAGAPVDVPPEVRFAAIYSNPPVRVGKAALHGLLLEWLERLAPQGHAYLVVQRHLGSDSLAAWLESEGFEVARLASKRGYRVLDISAASSS
ncbi:MAG TPA: methyltransferase [Candidatus Dormibacteraeota bacterium]